MKVSKRGVWGIVVGLVVVAGTGLAGYKESRTIGVANNLTQGFGSLGGVGHDPANDKFYVGCQIVGEQGKAVVGSCSAKNLAGKSMTCTTTAAYNDSVRMISAPAYIVINDMNLNGRCDLLATDVESWGDAKSTGAATASKVEVTISTGPDFVKGALGTVYNAPNQNLGCKMKGTATGLTVTCTARSNNNPQKAFDCSSSDASVVEAARSIKEDSYLEITRNGATCTKLLVKNDSRFAPRV